MSLRAPAPWPLPRPPHLPCNYSTQVIMRSRQQHGQGLAAVVPPAPADTVCAKQSGAAASSSSSSSTPQPGCPRLQAQRCDSAYIVPLSGSSASSSCSDCAALGGEAPALPCEPHGEQQPQQRNSQMQLNAAVEEAASLRQQLAAVLAQQQAEQQAAARLAAQLQERAAQAVAAQRRATVAEASSAAAEQRAVQAEAEAERFWRLLDLSHKASAGMAAAAQQAAADSAARAAAAEEACAAAAARAGASEKRAQQLEEQMERQRGVIAMLANSRGTAFEERFHLQVGGLVLWVWSLPPSLAGAAGCLVVGLMACAAGRLTACLGTTGSATCACIMPAAPVRPSLCRRWSCAKCSESGMMHTERPPT